MLAIPSVKSCYAQYGDDWIKFLGRLSHEQLAEAQRNANATIVASRFENFTMVAGEAVMNGCPLILSDRCGWRLPAALTHGALIVDPHDAEALAAALDHVGDPVNRPDLIASSKRLANWISSPELVERTLPSIAKCSPIRSPFFKIATMPPPKKITIFMGGLTGRHFGGASCPARDSPAVAGCENRFSQPPATHQRSGPAN